MRKQPDQFSNFRTCGALFARSFKSGTVSRKIGRGVLARGGRSFLNLEHFTTPFRVFVISSGYRSFTSVLQNAPSTMPDVFHVRPFGSVSRLSDKKPTKGISAWRTQNFSHSNINWFRSAT